MRPLALAALLGGCAGVSVERPAWRATLTPRDAAHARLALTARGGFHLNPDYPINFRGDAVRLERADFVVEAHAASAVTPRPTRGTLAFSVCDAERCLIEKLTLSLP